MFYYVLFIDVTAVEVYLAFRSLAQARKAGGWWGWRPWQQRTRTAMKLKGMNKCTPKDFWVWHFGPFGCFFFLWVVPSLRVTLQDWWMELSWTRRMTMMKGSAIRLRCCYMSLCTNSRTTSWSLRGLCVYLGCWFFYSWEFFPTMTSPKFDSTNRWYFQLFTGNLWKFQTVTRNCVA